MVTFIHDNERIELIDDWNRADSSAFSMGFRFAQGFGKDVRELFS